MVKLRDYLAGSLVGAGVTHIGDAIHYYTTGNMQEAENMAALGLLWLTPLICYGILYASVTLGIKLGGLESKLTKTEKD